MRVTAITAEYNPLHCGHKNHIVKARAETNADYIIAVISGNFVQRGAPAIISKYERAKSALMAGADLVIELPHYYSSGSLDYFAKGALSLISCSGLVDSISFGSECGDINLLKKAAEVMHMQASFRNNEIKKNLSQGLSYSASVNSSSDIPAHISEVLKKPNNLLAASYIAAAKELTFTCDLHTIKRTGAEYHDDTKGALSSSAIRREILSGNNTFDRMPENVSDSLSEYLHSYPPLSEDDFSLILFSRLQNIIMTAILNDSDPVKDLRSYLDLSENIANKIINHHAHASSYTDLCKKLKSKDLNYSRISRALIHILLDVRSDRMNEYVHEGLNYYIRLLGFKPSAHKLMHELKLRSSLPLITKAADAQAILRSFYGPRKAAHALRMFNEGVAADELYYKTACMMSRRSFKSEYEHSPVIWEANS